MCQLDTYSSRIQGPEAFDMDTSATIDASVPNLDHQIDVEVGQYKQWDVFWKDATWSRHGEVVLTDVPYQKTWNAYGLLERWRQASDHLFRA